MTFVVPLLVAFLSETDDDASTSPVDRRLHRLALKKLTDFGPRHPAEFHSVMQHRPDLRSRLERAIHGQSQQAAASAARSTAGTGEQRPAAAATTASIKLKMDFSNFAS